uniref:Uncharacterized protein n=1 Tax=Cannabis sativa TaxID=3483 RepID=A0A803PCC2_CANSA
MDRSAKISQLNSIVPAASVSESPSLPLPSPTVAHDEAPSSIAVHSNDAPFVSSTLANSISENISVDPTLFAPSTTTVLGSIPDAVFPSSGPIEQNSTGPVISCSALASASSSTMLLPFSSSTPILTHTAPTFTLSGTTTDPTIPFSLPHVQHSSPFNTGNNPFLGHQGHMAFADNSGFLANQGLSRAFYDRPFQDDRCHLGTGDQQNIISSFLLTGEDNFSVLETSGFD